jgi:raffinose/stachyose/melibiose transport system permease protein
VESTSPRQVALRSRELPRDTYKRQNTITVILFLLPAFVLFFLFLVYPIALSVYYSLFDWNGLGPAVDFVGLDNFVRILGDKIFLKAISNGLLIVALSLVIQLPLSLGLALMVGRNLPGRVFYRSIFFMPYVISEVIAAIMWLGLFNPDPTRGLINAVLMLIPGGDAQPWLGDMGSVLPSLFVVLTWKYFGLHMLLFMTGLQGIPLEIEEAARIDGANGWQLIMRILIPLLGSTTRTSIYLSVLGSLQQFILVWVMTKGGPVNASEVMATYMYRYGFVRFWLGYGSAVAIVMLLLSLSFSLFYQWATRRQYSLGAD